MKRRKRIQLPRFEEGTPVKKTAIDPIIPPFNPGQIPDFEVKGNEEVVGPTVEEMFSRSLQLPVLIKDEANADANRRKERAAREAVSAATNKYVAGQRNEISPREYMQLYWNSEGFRQRFNKGFGLENDDLFYSVNADNVRMPRRLKNHTSDHSFYTTNENHVKELGMLAPSQYVLYDTATSQDYMGMGDGATETHEISHHLYNPHLLNRIKTSTGNKKIPFDEYKNSDEKKLYDFIREYYERMGYDDSGIIDSYKHDVRGHEAAVNVGALGRMLYLDGIFDRTNPNDVIDEDRLKKWYKLYKAKNNGKLILPIEQFGIDKTVYLLNNTAQNTANPYQRMYNPVLLYTPNMNLNYEMA